MLLGMLVVAAPAAVAQSSNPGVNPGASSLYAPAAAVVGGAQEVYFPWVGNDDDFGLGAADSVVTIQNLTGVDGYVYLYRGTGSGWTLATTAYLSGGASKTFTPDDLDLPAGGAPVVAGVYTSTTILDVDVICELDFGADINGDLDLLDCIPVEVFESRWVPLFAAGVVKSAVAGDNLPYTTASDTSVSGYNGLSGREVGYFDAHYLPIVQTNCGPGGCWDTRLTVSNFRNDANAAVTIRFFPASDGSGSLQTGFQLQRLVDPGEAWSVNLSEWVPEGWVGSAHVLTDDAVGVIADRFKAGTDMWLTNIGSNQTAEFIYQDLIAFGQPYVLFAPAVYLDYNGWNTGISVANLANADNNINIQYYVNAGNAPSVQTQRLAAHGMTYFYNPSDPAEDGTGQDPVMDRLAGAVILSDLPVAAAVDAVKYFGNDANVGQAMTYNATGNIVAQQAMPLVQKGSPATGMGATSGLNLLNPYVANNTIVVEWLNQSGFLADNFGTTTVVVPPAAIGFAYTMHQHNLPNGYYGSAIATSLNEIPFGMTSANVDYQVQGDGSTIWNGYNPCGLFRQDGGCVYTLPEPEPEPAGTGFLEKTFVDALTGEPISNLDVVVSPAGSAAEYELGSPNSNGFIRTELTAGDYTLCWTDLTGIVPGDPANDAGETVYLNGCEDFTIVEDETTVLTNTLTPLSVGDVCVGATILIAFPVEGVEVTVRTLAGDVIGVGFTDEEGHVDFYLEPGTYVFTAEGGLYIDPGTGLTVPLSDVTVIDTIAEGDGDEGFLECDVEMAMLPMLDGEAATFTKNVTVDGTPVAGVTAVLAGTTTNQNGDVVCDTDAIIGFASTDAAGDATFVVEGDQTYCLILATDFFGDDIISEEIIDIPVGDSELTNALSLSDDALAGYGLLDVTVTLDGADGVFEVQIYEDAAGTATDGDGCWWAASGPLVTEGITGTDGEATFLVEEGTYCVSAFTTDGFFEHVGSDADVDVDAGATSTATIDGVTFSTIFVDSNGSGAAAYTIEIREIAGGEVFSNLGAGAEVGVCTGAVVDTVVVTGDQFSLGFDVPEGDYCVAGDPAADGLNTVAVSVGFDTTVSVTLDD